jgi:hypothetical protein
MDVLNTTFNNTSVLLYLTVLLIGARGISGENHRPVASN